MTEFAKDLVRQVPRLRAYALLLTRNGVEADDLVQETMLRAWRFRDQFHPGTNLPAWLFKILKNAFLRSVEQGRVSVGSIDDVIASQLATPPDQEWRLRYGELLLALDKLSVAGREALLLVAAAGLTYEEAAVVCGCSVGTVKSRVNRARARLCDLMAPDGAEPSSVERTLMAVC